MIAAPEGEAQSARADCPADIPGPHTVGNRPAGLALPPGAGRQGSFGEENQFAQRKGCLACIPRPMRVTQEKASSLQIRDADSDVLLDGEREPLTLSQYEALRDLCLRSARDFLALYRAVPQKQISVLAPRSTFYGPLPRTAGEMYEHTRRVNGYYFGEIGVEADCLGDDILRCRERGFAALQAQPGFLENRLYDGSCGEEWTLRKVMRRFLWHDRIHARAMRRMAARTFPHALLPDPFCFEWTEEKEESR